MTGICVLATFDGNRVDRRHIDAMAAAAPYRGANQVVRHAAGVALLSQRAPREAGTGASVAQVGGITVVADARIDNAATLRSTLARHGYLVDAHEPTPAELLLAAFRMWGGACPAALIGDYAFVAWDDRCRRLFGARDPMGMRPLYLRSTPRRSIALASEIKQILAVPGTPCRIFEPAIATTLAGPHTPASWTAYAGIEQLPPGRALVADRDGFRTFATWAPDPDVLDGIDEDAAVELFRSTFADAVRSRVGQPSTIGIFLSGGTDSGSVASMAGYLREHSPDVVGDLRTYSWAFDELPDSDERAVSNHIVERFQLTATDIDGDRWWPLAGYPEHGPDRDDPYIWVYQALIEHTLARCHDDGVTVQVVGDRGDELTGDWVFDEFGLVRAGQLRDALADLRTAVDDPGLSPLVALRRRVLRPYVDARWPAASRAARRRRGQSKRWPPWVRDDFAARVDLGDIIDDMRRPTPFGDSAQRQRYQRVFMVQGARIAVLRNRSRARHGMQFADPYSDRRLIELVLGLPQWMVQRRGQPKRLVRRAMDGITPAAAQQLSRKTIPYSLFDRGLRDRATDVVDGLLRGSVASACGWLDDAAVQRIYDEYRHTGDANHDFWWPLTVEMWLRRWWTDATS